MSKCCPSWTPFSDAASRFDVSEQVECAVCHGTREEHEQHMQSEAERRYQSDAEFKAAVDWLRHMAMKHGFTPYELKQIAFTAALINELYSVKSFRIPIDHLPEGFRR